MGGAALSDKLEKWKDWVERNEQAAEEQIAQMDLREKLYRGEVREITPLTRRDLEKDGSLRETPHVRNIVAENIESEVSSTIPQPKVTARRKADEQRAKILEDMLRNELDRLPMEELNDQAERTVPIQGGAYWLVEWDNSTRTHSTVGDVRVQLLHPKQIVPQDGVYTRVEDMDAIALKLPQTKEYIQRKYGKTVEDEAETDPDVRALDEEADTAEDMVTQYVVYYRNDKGGVGKISWVNDTVLEDMEDYQIRIQDGSAIDTEDVITPIRTELGTEIPGAQAVVEPDQSVVLRPTRLPYYKPDVFPVFLQRNVSLFGQLLGDSDVDKIADQQNTVSRLERKIIDRLIKAGTRITLPDKADLRTDPEDAERWYLRSPADKALIDVYEFKGDLRYELEYLAQVYEEARQILGITDSFQGRRDTTAQSGVAKEFAANQSAGRLESKRVLKEAAYAELFKRIAQLKIAYADEPRSVVAADDRGEAQYEEFNRYDYYEQDASGEWHCILDDDRFLFSCDSSTPLANNRPQMWQEASAMYQMGAFGQPGSMEALMLYWTKLELLHYPGASDTKEYLTQMQQQQQMLQMQQMAQQQAMAEAQRQAEQGQQEQQLYRDIDAQAREHARQDAMRMMGGPARGSSAP